MDLFFDVLKRLTKLELILRIGKEMSKMDIRPVSIYAVLGDDNEVIVSQTKPPLGRNMIGKELEASFVASIKKDKIERFFFVAKVKRIGLFGLSRNKLVEAIFLMPVKKEIYKRSLRVYPRINCEKDSVYVRVLPGEDKFQVIDISEGGLCFKCEKNMVNSIRFIPHKESNIAIEFSDDQQVMARAEIVRRFEEENYPDTLFIGIKFVEFPKGEEKRFVKIIEKLRGRNKT